RISESLQVGRRNDTARPGNDLARADGPLSRWIITRMTIRDDAAVVARDLMRSVFFGALFMACVSCGGERLRSVRGDTTDRKRASETFGAHLRAPSPVPDRIVSLREVVVSPALVGHRVLVIGRCFTSTRVLDRPAKGRDAWRLEADGVAVL